MSYILDALKKADAERKLGSIPDIYAATPPETTVPKAGARRAWLPRLLALNALAIIAAAGAWFALRQPPLPSPTPAVAVPPSPSPVAAIPTAPQPATMTPRAAPTTASAPASDSTPESRSTKLLTQAQPARPPAASAASAVMPPKEVKAEPKMKTVQNGAPPANTGTPAAEDKPVGTLRDLPDSIQREIPATVVNGYIYAKNPADRTVLINNKLLHEGEQVEPGLIVEKMTPKGMVMNFKGYRYQLPIKQQSAMVWINPAGLIEIDAFTRQS